MELFEYDNQWSARIFSLQNSGVLCYLNSLIQVLMSLPHFNKVLLDNETKFAQSNNKLALQLISLFKSSRPQDGTSGSMPCFQIDDILRELIARRKVFQRSGSLSIGRQEDADEGFHMLMNTIDGNLNNLNSHTSSNIIERCFHIRYDTIIECRECGSSRNVSSDMARKHVEPPEIVIHVPVRDDVIGPINSQKAMQRYVKTHSEYPDDYRCDKCGIQNNNSQNEHHVLRKQDLRRLSSMIVITFKNYPAFNGSGRKMLHYFPPVMTFESKSGTLTYRAVAKIEHFGSESGGHYIAICQRSVNPALHEKRNEKYRNAINKLEANRTPENAEDIKTLKRVLRRSQNAKTDIFEMNDRRISYSSEGIKPTENTYMVFYHLQPTV